MSLRKFLNARTLGLSFLLVGAAIATDVTFRAEDPVYQASYSVDTSNPDNSELHVQLELLNYDISNWTITNENGTFPSGQGVFMGIGLGSQAFGVSDLIICNFTQDAEQSKQLFDCFDYQV